MNRRMKAINWLMLLMGAGVFLYIGGLSFLGLTVVDDKFDVNSDDKVDMYDLKYCLSNPGSCDFDNNNVFDEADTELMWEAIQKSDYRLLPLSSVPEYSCNDADLDGDGEVGYSDLIILAAQYGECGNYLGDINGDGCVDYDDKVILAAYYGQTCTLPPPPNPWDDIVRWINSFIGSILSWFGLS